MRQLFICFLRCCRGGNRRSLPRHTAAFADDTNTHAPGLPTARTYSPGASPHTAHGRDSDDPSVAAAGCQKTIGAAA